MSGEIDHQKDAELYDLKDRLLKAEWVLERLNYRHCDIPACNCNGYHRMTEPDELDHLRQDNERLKGEVEAQLRLTENAQGMALELVHQRDKFRADLQRHKSCLEVARGALMAADQFMRGCDEKHFVELRERALHQINEVLGGDTKPT